MKWIGQNIYDFISRFRSDVYLEDISTGTIASGAHLGLDSNNKIVKAVDGGGDLTSIVAGTGLTGSSLTSGDATLNVIGGTGITANANDIALTNGLIADGSNITSVGTIGTGVWQGTTIKTAYIGDDQVTEGKLANTLLAEIDANTDKNTNVTTNLTATTHASQITINSSDGTNVVVAEASGSIAGVMSVTHHDKLDAIEASATADQSKSDIDGLAITPVGTLDTGNVTAVVDAASASAAGKVELATTGEADTGTDTARAVTAAGLKSHVDARYTYQYIVFLCDSDAIVSNQFITPGANGISNHLWNDDSDLDYTGTDATTIGHANAHITMNFQMATASIIVPQACDLAGFYAVGRNESSQTNNFGIGMFVSEESDAAYGGTATWDATLRAFSLSDGTSRLDRAQKIDGMLTTPFAMTAGDLITPAVVAPTGNQVKTTITLVLRTKIA